MHAYAQRQRLGVALHVPEASRMSVPHCHIERLDVPLGQPRPSLAIPPKSSPKESFTVGRPRLGAAACATEGCAPPTPPRPRACARGGRKWQHRHRLPYHHSSCGCGGASWRSVDMLASTQKLGRASRGREYKVSTSWRGLQQYQGLGSRLMALPIANSAEFNTSIQSLQP